MENEFFINGKGEMLALYEALKNVTGGEPWIQIIVGILSIIVSLVMFAGDKSEEV